MKKSDITPKQLAILILLYRFRFLNSKQIQMLLNHKNPVRSHAWLSDLVNKGYIKGHYDRGTFGENTKPTLFHLLPLSRKVLKNLEECEESILNLIYKDGKRSQRFIDHCLLLADIYLKYRKESESEGFILHFLTKSDLASYEALPNPLPDAYIATKGPSGESSKYFLEIVDSGTPRFALRGKVRGYINYEQSGDWGRHINNEVATVLFICLDANNMEYLKKFVEVTSAESFRTKFLFSNPF